MEYSSSTYHIPAGLELNVNIGFAPRAAIINNYTPFYIYFPDGPSFCPPWTSGAIIPLGHATQARASWLNNPFGHQALYTTTDIIYTATITFTDNPNAGIGGGTVIPEPYDTRSSVFFAMPGNTITTGTLAFSAYGCRIDNYTGTWYEIGTTGILVPPFTTGFTIDIIPPVTSLILSPAIPPYGTNETSGTQVVLTLYAAKIGNSSGNTVIVHYPIQLLQSNTLATTTQNSTISLPTAATADNLLVAVFAYADASARTVTGPAGWTTIFTTSPGATTGCWIGYKKAIGGETNASFTLSGATAPANSICIAEYTGFDPTIFQTANASGNTASVTPTTSPLITIGLSAYANASSIAAGSVTSADTVIRASITNSNTSSRSGAAISDLNYDSVSAKTVTLVWSGGAANRTGIITGE